MLPNDFQPVFQLFFVCCMQQLPACLVGGSSSPACQLRRYVVAVGIAGQICLFFIIERSKSSWRMHIENVGYLLCVICSEQACLIYVRDGKYQSTYILLFFFLSCP